MFVESPDKGLRLDISLVERGGTSLCEYRLTKSGRVVLAASSIGLNGAVSECRISSLGVRGKSRAGRQRGTNQDVLAREIAVFASDSKTSPVIIFRVSDDSFAVFATGRGVTSFDLKLPNTLLGACVPICSDGHVCGYAMIDGPSFRSTDGRYDGIVFYRRGICATVLANCSLRVAIMTFGINPATAIMPRMLRYALSDLPRRAIRHIAAGDCVKSICTPSDPACNVGVAFLAFRYIAADMLASGMDIDALRYSRPYVRKKGKGVAAVLSDEQSKPTVVHAEAYGLLTDPHAAEAASGFRGEIGEYLCGARRTGDSWVVAGITSKLRVLTLFFPYLDPEVKYRATWKLDEGATLPTNAVNPTPPEIAYGDKACVRMNPNGGFVLLLEPIR